MHRGLGTHVIIGAAALAVDGTGAADVYRHHPDPLAGMGQASDGAADLVHDGHEVCGRDRRKARSRPATRPPALGRPTAVSDRPRCASRLLHAPRRLTEQRTVMAARRLSRRHKRILQWLTADHQRTRGMITSSHQDLVRALPGDKGNISHSLQTLEARGLIVIGRSPGGKAESLWLTPEGQKWASQLTGSWDVLPGMNAGASPYAGPSPIEGSGT